MRKIYFACSIRGGRQDQAIYANVVSLIKAEAIVLSELFADKSLSSQGHTHLTDSQIWQRDIGWLEEADALIAEVTNPSLGVGYEIARAEELNKPILVLYRPATGKRLSAMIAGSPKVTVAEYNEPQELKVLLAEFIKALN